MMTGNLGCSRTTVATSGFEGSQSKQRVGASVDGEDDARPAIGASPRLLYLEFFEEQSLFHNENETLHLH
jgi:hypothetical protein